MTQFRSPYSTGHEDLGPRRPPASKLDGAKVSSRNVVLFGAPGAGKSSIVNMLVGGEVAKTSNGSQACTLNSTSHEVTIGGTSFRIHDTTGLEEGESGRIPKTETIVQLFGLLKSLKDGVSLLAFCVRAGRMKESTKYNWSLFYDVICQKEVPVVLVVTGLETEEEPMDRWLDHPENWDQFRKNRIYPHGSACITAIKGKKSRGGKYTYQEEYDESKRKVETLLLRHSLETPWRMPKTKWLAEIGEGIYKYLPCKRSKGFVSELELVEKCGMGKAEAAELAKKFAEVARGNN